MAGEPIAPRATPRFFWLAAGVFAAAIVAISWYWSAYVRVPPGGYFAPVVTQVENHAPPDTSPETAPPLTAVAGDTLSGAAAAESAVDTVAAPVPVPALPVRSVASAFDPAPYAAPAGAAGWALHVYSLPDSAGAATQAAELERAGYRTAVRIVEIKEKGGRWWRLYVGSFPSSAAARAAMPALLARLGATWADPAHIQDSAP